MSLHKYLWMCVLPSANIYHLNVTNSVPTSWPTFVPTYCPQVGQHVLILNRHLF